ncbi:MAG TPA: DUF2336 domain-containing protein [Devosia sp.]|nr:DUF2336 domain-containing protein [Devosia sp.]
MVSAAYAKHDGPADERAALYAAVLGFMDDTSVKVRASLAYGLLHAETAPHLVMVSLANDAPIIARAVVQYSPVLLDVDLLAVAKTSGVEVREAIANRKQLSAKLIRALVSFGHCQITLSLLERGDIRIPTDVLERLTAREGKNARFRGRLLRRPELPALCRLALVKQVSQALGNSRLVKGAVSPARLRRLMGDALDNSTTLLGELEVQERRSDFTLGLHAADRLNTRLLLHALVNGRVLFFADCLALLAEVPHNKVFALLGQGSRVGLNALLSQCGMAPALRNLVARLVIFARTADLSDDISAKHFIVTALTRELVVEHDGKIPDELEQAFTYLNEQNVKLAREAAQGVMPAFSEQSDKSLQLPEATRIESPDSAPRLLALSAA